MRSVASVAFVWSVLFGYSVHAADAPVDFDKDIRPVFKESCVGCHSLDNPKHKAASKFRLDDKELAMKGGENGKDIIPGNAKDSLLYKLLLGEVTNKDGDEIDAMPKPKHDDEKWRPLPKEKVELIRRWIDEGAKWPD